MLLPLPSVLCPFQLLLLIVGAVFIILAQCCGCGGKKKGKKADKKAKNGAGAGQANPPGERSKLEKSAVGNGSPKEAAVPATTPQPAAGETSANVAKEEGSQRKKEKPDIFITKKLPENKKREFVSGKNPDYETLKQLDMQIFLKKKLSGTQARPHDFQSTMSSQQSAM